MKSDGAYAWSTYDAFGHDVNGFRGALARLGVRRGDAVAVVSSNCVQWAVGAFATFGIGAVYVPMFSTQPAEVLRFVLEDSRAKVVLVGTEAIRERVEALRGEVATIEHVLSFEASGRPHAFAAHLVQGHDTESEVVRPKKDDPATILYTSGTTGTPKGVVLSHGNIISNINAVRQVHDIRPDDVSCSFLPWAHAFGQTCELYGMMSAGASIGLTEDVDSLMEDLQSVRPTVLFAVPQVWNTIHSRLQKSLADAPAAKRAVFERGLSVARRRRDAVAKGERSLRLEAEYALFSNLLFSTVRERFGGRLRYALSGGAALSTDVAQLIEDLGIEMFEGYGLTETSPIVSTNTPDAHRLGTVGRAIPGVDVFVCDAGGEVLGPDQEGELVVAGPNVMLGYHDDEAATEAVIFDLDGLRAFRTGDVGTKSPGGFITLTGRRKETYKLADGTFVVPTPIEQRIALSPLVAQVMVYGENREHNVALIVPEYEALTRWANHEGLDASTPSALAAHPEVHARIGTAIEECFRGRVDGTVPRGWAVLPEPFSVDNGLLTPKLSLRRAAVVERYRSVLDGLY